MTRARPIDLRLAGASDVGRERENNEDRLVLLEPGDEDIGWVLCVADGMGGHPAGEEASERVVAEVARLREYAPPKHTPRREAALVGALRGCIERAHEAIVAIGDSDPEKLGLGTTVVAAHVVGRNLHVLHCGDSRTYLLRGDTLEQITADHVIVEDRIRYLAAHVGLPEGLLLEHDERALETGDRILVCSDGLTDMVPGEIFGLALHEARDPAQAVEALIELANLAGGLDNVTCAVAFVG